MPVLISLLLLIFAVGFILVVNFEAQLVSWGGEWVTQVSRWITSYHVTAYGLAIGASLVSLFTAVQTMFNARNSDLAIGGKKSLAIIALLAAAALVFLCYKAIVVFDVLEQLAA